MTAQPGSRPLEPAPAPRLAADEFYVDLLADISISEDADRALRSWVGVAIDRLLASLRPHRFDVDAMVCGSFATGTHIQRSDLDVDVVVRFHSRHAGWDEPDRLLGDLQRWLRQGVDAKISRERETVTITTPGALGVRVIPCWREGSGVWSAPSGLGRSLRRGQGLDPVGHRDLMVARQLSIGGGAFAALVRVVKHLNAGWRRDGSSALSSYDIDALALELCWEPVALAEAVPQFLGAAAAACAQQRAGGRGERAPWAQTEARLREAAELTERAIMTADRQAAIELLREAFGERESSPEISADRLSQRAVC